MAITSSSSAQCLPQCMADPCERVDQHMGWPKECGGTGFIPPMAPRVRVTAGWEILSELLWRLRFVPEKHGGTDEVVPQVSGQAAERVCRGTGGMGPPVGEVSAWMKGVLACGVHMFVIWRGQQWSWDARDICLVGRRVDSAQSRFSFLSFIFSVFFSICLVFQLSNPLSNSVLDFKFN
jgi:hypothetical protein